MTAGLWGYQDTSAPYTVDLTDAGTAAKAQPIGMNNGTPGQLIYEGVAPAAVISPGSVAPTLDAPVYLALASDQAGALTCTAPTAVGTTTQLMGYVVQVNSPTNVDMFIRVGQPIDN